MGSPRLTPMPTTMVDTTDLELMDTTLLARGLLMLSLLLMLMPTTTDIPPMDTDPMATTLLARGLLMLSPLLMPTTTDMLPPMPTDPMVLTPTEPDTTDTGKLPISTKDLPSSRNENQLPQPATKDLKFPFLFVPLIPFSAFKFMYHHM